MVILREDKLAAIGTLTSLALRAHDEPYEIIMYIAVRLLYFTDLYCAQTSAHCAFGSFSTTFILDVYCRDTPETCAL